MVHDGHGLKLQKVGPIFSSLNAMHAKFSKKKIMFVASSMIFFKVFFISCSHSNVDLFTWI